MEAAQHDPDGGERAPGALEDGHDASSGAPEVPPAAANEGPQDQGTSANEGPHKSRSWAPEGPSGDPPSRGGETSCHAGAAEGPCGARFSPGRHETPGCAEEREVSRAREEPHVSGEQRHGAEGPSHSGTSAEGPPDSGTSGEEPSDFRTSGEEPSDFRTSSEEPSDSGTFREEPSDSGTFREEPSDSGTSGEGPRSPGASSPSEPGREERHPQPAPTGGSFKKPVAPGEPAGREKTLEPTRDQPTRPPGHPAAAPHGQTAPVICSGLPPDASRAAPALPYQEPPWSGRPEALYSLEVLKGGAILSTKDLREANWTAFGRLPTCHVSLEHPSVSRYHAVLQYRAAAGDEPDQQRGFYIYDLGSTHGTFVNKQRIPPKAYHRVRVGHVMKFGGSTRLFILQGPDDDQEAESELTVTQIKEARRQMETLQKRMLGDDSDEEDEPTEEGKKEKTSTGEESGCMWGMGEDAIEDESEENPIAMEFQEDREALYLKNPKKALQGFFDREGEELEFEYDERGPGSWICRVKLPADDSAGKQLVAEVTHTGKKKEAANLCALEACRMLDMRGLLRQEAVSRKRKAKKWEDEDFYDSDDDTFLDRTGIVEKKRLNRMKKAGKIEEKPETFESLTAKLELVEKEISEVATKLRTSQAGVTQSSAQDSLDAFMTEIKAGSSLDSVSRKKLHIQSLELKKEQQRLKSLIKIVQPTKLPELKTNSTTEDPKAKKLTLPLFGAMKGGSKFKLKTGTVGRLPPKRTDLPPSLFTMKDTDEPEEEEEDEDEEMKEENPGDGRSEDRPTKVDTAEHTVKKNPVPETQAARRIEVQRVSPVKEQEAPESSSNSRSQNGQKQPAPPTDATPKAAAEKQKRMHGPSKPPQGVLGPRYPEDDPDYCVWTPPAGQTGDGKTHLNEKYGY